MRFDIIKNIISYHINKKYEKDRYKFEIHYRQDFPLMFTNIEDAECIAVANADAKSMFFINIVLKSGIEIMEVLGINDLREIKILEELLHNKDDFIEIETYTYSVTRSRLLNKVDDSRLTLIIKKHSNYWKKNFIELDATTLCDGRSCFVIEFNSMNFFFEYAIPIDSDLSSLIEIDNFNLNKDFLEAFIENKTSPELNKKIREEFSEDWLNEKLLIYELGD